MVMIEYDSRFCRSGCASVGCRGKPRHFFRTCRDYLRNYTFHLASNNQDAYSVIEEYERMVSKLEDDDKELELNLLRECIENVKKALKSEYDISMNEQIECLDCKFWVFEKHVGYNDERYCIGSGVKVPIEEVFKIDGLCYSNKIIPKKK